MIRKIINIAYLNEIRWLVEKSKCTGSLIMGKERKLL